MNKKSSRDPKKIVLVRLGALGDVCMITPLLFALRRHFPESQIDWVIDRVNYPLVEGLKGVNLIPIEKPRSLKQYLNLYRQFKLHRYDVLLLAQANLRVNVLSRLISAQKRYGFGRLHSHEAQYLFVNHYVKACKEHLVDAFMRFAEALGVTDLGVCWNLPRHSTADKWVLEQVPTQKYWAVCLSASKTERDWSLESYTSLIRYLRNKYDLTIVLIGGPDNREQQRANTCCHDLNDSKIFNLVGKSSVKQLKSLIEQADVLIAPDTGPVHIAVAVGTPVVGLYAVAPSSKTGPYRHLRWVVDAYEEGIRKLLRKKLDKISWRTRVHHPQAMYLVCIDEVIARCEDLWESLKK